jgi:hypothetical protein
MEGFSSMEMTSAFCGGFKYSPTDLPSGFRVTDGFI